jgi:MFS family permease
MSPERVPRAYVAALMVAYLGATVALYAPLQNILPRMVEAVSSPSGKGVNLGLVTSFGAVAAMISNPLSGYFADRWGHRDNRSVALLTGMATGCCSLALLAAATSLEAIVGLWVLSQVTINIAYSAMTASVVDHVPRARWGTVWGLVGIAQAVGLIAGFAILTVALPSLSSGSRGLAAMYGACLIPLIIVVRRLPRRPAPARRPRPVLLLATSGAFGRVWAGKFLVIMANGLAVMYLYYYLQDVIRYPSPGQGQLILVLISTCASAASAVTVGRLGDRSGAYQWLAVIGVALMSLVAFELSVIGTWPLAIIGALVLGAGYGIFVAMSQTLSNAVLPDPASAGRDLGIINIAGALPQVIGPPLAVAIFAIGVGYRGIFASAGILLLIAAWLFSRIRPARASDGDE